MLTWRGKDINRFLCLRLKFDLQFVVQYFPVHLTVLEVRQYNHIIYS